MANEKTPARKEAPSPAPAPAQQEIKITIPAPTITLDFGPNFQMKLVILGIFLFIFAFSLYMFSRVGFAISDLFDMGRLQYNLPKLWSIAMIVFTILYGVAVGLAAYFGQGIPKMQSALALVIGLAVAGIMSLLAPAYFYAYVGLAIAAGAAAIAASFYKDMDWSAAWGATSKAMTILLIMAFLLTFMRVAGDREKYTDVMFAGISSAVPDLAGDATKSAGTMALNLCADAVEKAEIKQEDVEKALTAEKLKTALAGNAIFSAMPAATQDSVVFALQPVAVTQTMSMAGELKKNVAKSIRDQAANTSAAAIPAIDPKQIKAMASGMPMIKQMTEFLPIIAALSVLSVVGVISIAAKLVAALVAWGIAKAMAV